MANVKITALTNLSGTDAEDRDVFVIDDVSATETKKITVANVITFTGNAHLVSSNLDSFATGANAEDIALQARITANADLSASNDFATYTRLQANIDLVQDNVASVTVGTAADTETRLNANLDIVQDNVVAAEANVVLVRSNVDSLGTYANTTFSTISNAESLASEDVALQARIAANTDLSASNDFITYTRLNANVDIVQDNVTAQNSYITTNYTTLLLTDSVQDNVASAEANVVAVETRRSDNVFFSLNLTGQPQANIILSDANVEPTSNNVYSLGAPDKVWKDVFIGPGSLQLGEVTISALGEEGISITGASGEQANITTPSQGGVANVSAELEGLQSRLSTNVTAFTNEDAALQSRLTTNVNIFTNEDTALQARIDANALVAASNDFVTYTRLNANVDLVQDNVALVRSNVDSLGSYSNTTFSTVANAAALAAEDVALQARLATNVTAFTNEDTALQARLTSNVDTLTTNINTLDANADAIEARRAANLVSAVFTSDVTVSGNLIVTGAQVDLGVQTATIQNNFIELSAELNPGDAPSTDSGLLINRGNKGNVFIGDHLGEDGVIFVRTQTPDTNTTIAIESFMDLHGNNFHAAGDVNLQRVHFGLRASEDTGIILDDAGANINFIADGSYVANVHYDGTINSQNAIIAPKVFAGGVELQANDSATLFSARANDFATYTHITANVDVVQDNVATNATDIAAVETRRTNNIAGAVSTITTSDLTASRALIAGTGGKIEVSDVTATELGHLDGVTSAIQTQLNAKQATITGAATTIDDTNLTASRALVSDGSGKVAVSAVTATELGHLDGVSSAIQTQLNSKISTTDSASNDFITFTRVNANVNVVQDNVAAVETRRTNNIAGAVSTITTSDLTASRAVVSDGSGKVAVSAVTATEIGHLDGVTSAIQTQLNSKIATTDSASNDFVTFTRLDANIDVVSSNATAFETRRVANIAGAVSTITTSDLTASRALVSSGSGKVAVSAVTSTELGYLDGVTSAIQTQLNAKQATITGAATTIDDTNLTASRALVSDGSGKVAVSDITSTELAFLDGLDQNLNSNLVALAAGIAASATGVFPTGDYGLLDAANAATDAFGFAVADLTIFDMSDTPAGELDAQDLGALT